MKSFLSVTLNEKITSKNVVMCRTWTVEIKPKLCPVTIHVFSPFQMFRTASFSGRNVNKIPGICETFHLVRQISWELQFGIK